MKIHSGPTGSFPIFGRVKGSVLFIRKGANSSSRLLRWSPSSGEVGDRGVETLLESSAQLTSPVLSPDRRFLAMCQGKTIQLMRLSNLLVTTVFEARSVPLQLTWPVPSRLTVP